MRPPFLYEVNEMKDLLKLLDLSREEIVRILDVADQMKYDQKHRLPHPRLQGKTLAHDLREELHPHPGLL